MSMSLRDQLLAAGLGSKQQAKRAEQEQRRERKQARRDGGASEGARPTAAERARAEKAERDRELNRRQQESAEARARLGMVRQWADRDRLPPVDADGVFNFVDAGKVRRVRVDAARRAALLAGEVVIVRVGDRYEQLPAAAATRIRERAPECVIDVAAPPAAAGAGDAGAAAAGGDDPYKDYVVPDDLVW